MRGSSLKSLSVWEKRELATLLEEAERRRKRRLIHSMYPDSGPLRRELYAKHMQFFRARRPARHQRARLHGRQPRRQDLGRRRLRADAASDRRLSRVVGRPALCASHRCVGGRRYRRDDARHHPALPARTDRRVRHRAHSGRCVGRRADAPPRRRRRGRYGRGAACQRRHQPARLQELRPGPPQIPGHGQARDLGGRGAAGRRAQRMPAAADDGRRALDADLHAALRHFRGRVPLHQGSARCPIW